VTQTPVLRVIAGSDLGAFVVLDGHTMTIVGPDPSSNLVLRLPGMSALDFFQIRWLATERVVEVGRQPWAPGEAERRYGVGTLFEVPGAFLRVDLLASSDLERLIRRRQSWAPGPGRDPVTGLADATWIRDDIPVILAECRRLGTPAAGARVLVGGGVDAGIRRQVARMALLCGRERDRWFQLSEDEMLGVFPGTSAGEATADMARFARDVASAPWECTAIGLEVGVSIGVAVARLDDTVETWLAAMATSRVVE